MLLVDLLKTVQAFRELDRPDLEAIGELCEVQIFTAGQKIAQAGQDWDALYLITEGQVRVVNESAGGPAITLDVLHTGNHFGERCFFTDFLAEHSVYSDSPTTTLSVLKTEIFQHFLETHSSIQQKLENYALRQTVWNHLLKSKLFTKLSTERIEALLPHFQRQEFKRNDILMREGEAVSQLYLVEVGQLRRYRQAKPDKIIQTIHSSQIIGDQELQTGKPARDSIMVDSRFASIFTLDGEKFLEALAQPKSVTPLDKLLQSFKLFKPEAPISAPVQDVTEAFRCETEAFRARRQLPAVRQHSQMDCGAACLASVCRYYGKRVSLNRMRELARVGTSGASMANLIRAARELGFEPLAMKSTWEHLQKSSLPAIVNWKGYHWVVVYEVTPTRVILADPAEGLITLSRTEFMQGCAWYTIYLQPTPKIREIPEQAPRLGQFWPYFGPYRGLLMEVALASLVVQLLGLLVPLFTKFIVDEVIVQQRESWLPWAVGGMAAALGGLALVSLARQKLLLHLSLKVNLTLIRDFYRQLLVLPLTYFEDRKIGDLTTRFQENEKITQFLSQQGVQGLLDLITALLYIGLMLYYSPALTLVALGCLALNFLLIYLVTPLLRRAYRSVFAKEAEQASHLLEALRGWSVIKTLGVQHRVRGFWENRYLAYTNAFLKTLRYGVAANLVSDLVTALTQIAVLFYGTWLVLHHQMTIGTLMAFLVLTKGVAGPLQTLVELWDLLQDTLNAVERLNDVLEAAPETTASGELVSLRTLQGGFQLENLTFRYHPDAPSNVVQNLNLEIEPGEWIAFVGRSGSGKSTIMKLLSRFYRPSEGKIYVDGFDLEELDLGAYRQHLGFVTQTSYLFPGTIRDNIAKGNPAASLPEVMEAARMAGAHDFIKSFPKGYDTLVHERGRNLSGGQVQRICLARIFLQNPRVLILDEATSALDNESERFVQQNLERVFRGKTVLMIAHRLSTVQQANRIVVLERGNILEIGTHAELLERQGFYHHLWTQQISL